MRDNRYEDKNRYDGNSWVDKRGWYEKDDKGEKGGNYEKDDQYDKEYPAEDDRKEYDYYPEEQTHVHEFQGSTKLAEEEEERHNHRFAGISGEAIKIPGGHVHKIITRTDFFDHFHFICKFTGPAIPVDRDEKEDKRCGKKKMVEHHVHFVEAFTSVNDQHRHEFEVATLIESPLLPLEDEDIR